MSWKWKQNVYFSEATISGEQLFVWLFVCLLEQGFVKCENQRQAQ